MYLDKEFFDFLHEKGARGASAEDLFEQYGIELREELFKDPYSSKLRGRAIALKLQMAKTRGFFKGKVFQAIEYVQWFTVKNDVYTSKDTAYVFSQKKYFRPMEDREIKFQCLKHTDNKAQGRHLNEVVEIMKSHTYVQDANYLRRNSQGKINLNNGVLDLKTKNLLPHAQKYYFDYVLPHDYKPDCECKEWLKFLDDIFGGDPQLITVSAELFGYVLLGGDPFLHIAIILYGTGRNGKSTFLNVLNALLGSDNVSHISMKDIGKPFAAISFEGKLANIVEETPNDRIDAEAFKNIVGGGFVRASQKYRPEFDLKVNARLLFATNKHPKFVDTSIGLLDRLFILPFDKYISPEKRDPQLTEKLRNELPGILNWALSGVERLLEAKRINLPDASKKILAEYQQESDTVFYWVNQQIEVKTDSLKRYSVANLFDQYRTFTERGNQRPVGRPIFEKRFAKHLKEKVTAEGYHFDSFRKKSGDGRYYCGIWANEEATR